MNGAEQLHYIGPSVVLLVGAAVVLTADLAGPGLARNRSLALATALGAFAYTAVLALGDTRGEALGGAVTVDEFGLFFSFLLTAILAAIVLTTWEGLGRVRQDAEFFALLLTSTGAMVLLAQSLDLITIFVALETTSIAQFVLVGLARDARSSEAGLKYLLTGAVSAAVLLYGFAILFGLSGSTHLPEIAAYVADSGDGVRLGLLAAFVFIAAGVGFKMAIAPFHAWVPDVYEGAPTPVTAFLSVASKAAGFALVLRIFYSGLAGGDAPISEDWAAMFAVLAGASMLFGNTAAILQTDAKRLLGYSSIAQAGNIAVGLAAVAAGSTAGPAAVLFFLGAYAATNLGAFVCVILVARRLGSTELAAYGGLWRRSPVLAGVLALCLLSLTGIPPTAGFIAKVYIFDAAIGTGEAWLVWLVVVAVFNTAISAFYYLRWARTMFLDEPAEGAAVAATPVSRALLAAAVVGVLVLGLLPTPLIEAARRAAETLV